MLNILHGVPNTESVKKLIDKLGDELQLCWWKGISVILVFTYPPRPLLVVRYDRQGHWKGSIVFPNQALPQVLNLPDLLSNPDIAPLSPKEMARLPFDSPVWDFWKHLDSAIALLQDKPVPFE